MGSQNLHQSAEIQPCLEEGRIIVSFLVPATELVVIHVRKVPQSVNAIAIFDMDWRRWQLGDFLEVLIAILGIEGRFWQSASQARQLG